MCGLFGAIAKSNLIAQELKVFHGLAFINELRGEDSTGMFAYHRKGKGHATTYHKDLSPPSEYLRDHIPKVFRDAGPLKTFIAGHARAATIGDKTNVNNAHPFTHGNIIGMHNGTIRSAFKHSSEFGTDSEAVIYNIHKYGHEETIKMLNGLNDAAFALVWFDTDKNKLYFIRNSKRTLYFTNDNDGVGYYSSDDAHLKIILNMYKKHAKASTTTLLPVGELWTYSFENGGYKKTTTPFFKNVEAYSPYRQSYSQSVQTNTYRGQGTTSKKLETSSGAGVSTTKESKQGSPSTTTGSKKEQSRSTLPQRNSSTSLKIEMPWDEEEVTRTEPVYSFPVFNSFRNREDFTKILNGGCSCCGSPADFDKKSKSFPTLGWTSVNDFICTGCLSLDVVQNSGVPIITHEGKDI